jgi:nuclear protein localization protein 4 homolog
MCLHRAICPETMRIQGAKTAPRSVQASDDLKEHLSKHSSKPYGSRLRDFHLLLWLAKTLHWSESDVQAVAASAGDDAPLMEGYKLMIDSMAGL